MHPIRKYLENVGTSQVEFSRRLGITPQTLNDVLQGRSHLGRVNSLMVVKLTGGKIPLEELLLWEPSAESAASVEEPPAATGSSGA